MFAWKRNKHISGDGVKMEGLGVGVRSGWNTGSAVDSRGALVDADPVRPLAQEFVRMGWDLQNRLDETRGMRYDVF